MERERLPLLLRLPDHLLYADLIYQCLLGQDSGEALQFRVSCFSRAVYAGRRALDVPISVEDFENLLDFLRPESTWPLRPRLSTMPNPEPLFPKLQIAPAVETGRFKWCWYMTSLP